MLKGDKKIEIMEFYYNLNEFLKKKNENISARSSRKCQKKSI